MVKQKTLKNGLRVIVKQMEGLYSVTMGILVGTGSSVETDAEDGISHFIEHMQFKGTQKRNSYEISDAFERIGAQVNAFTAKDITCYYSKCTKDHTAESFEILADLFLNATYPKEEIDREKGVICEEISMNEDTPEDLCLDLLATASFGNQGYGRNILGPAATVQGFTMDDVNRYKSERYCPENIVISFAGSIDFEQAFELVERYFAQMPKGNFVQRKAPEQLIQSSLLKTKPIEQYHMAIGYPTIGRHHPKGHALQTMNSILGGGMSSRLFQEVREKQGLAYSVYSYPSLYDPFGILTIYAGVNAAKANAAYEAIDKVIRDLREKGVTDEEFIRAREQMKASMIYSLESTSSQMLIYAKELLFKNEIYNFDERFSDINLMNKNDVLELIDYTFAPNGKSVAVVGNTETPLPL